MEAQPLVRAAVVTDDVAGWVRRYWQDTIMAVHGQRHDVAALPALADELIVGVLSYLVEADAVESCCATRNHPDTGWAGRWCAPPWGWRGSSRCCGCGAPPREQFPDQPDRHLLYETIYQVVYRPELDGLVRELPQVLRTGRRRRKPRRRPDARAQAGWWTWR